MEEIIKTDKKNIILILTAISGISFWFWIGFPFYNHNESYYWVAKLQNLDFVSLLLYGLEPVTTYRPLGLLTAWISFNLGGGSIFPQQIFNYLICCISFIILLFSVENKHRLIFAILLGFIGLTTFPGYIYLFHIHGVFYSQVIFALSFFLYTYNKINFKRYNHRHYIFFFCVGLICSLFHPFSFLIYLAFIIGVLIENRKLIKLKTIILNITLILLAIIILKILSLKTDAVFKDYILDGFYTSYKLTELNIFISISIFLMILLGVRSINQINKYHKQSFYIIYFILSILFIFIKIPLTFLWIAICFYKTFILKKWVYTFLLITLSILPLSSASGTPTYIIFDILFLTYLTSVNLDFSLKWPFTRLLIIYSLGILFLVILIRADIKVPLISNIALPLLSEKEKTKQLEELLVKFNNSSFKNNRLVLWENAELPVFTPAKAERRFRPPTYQHYLSYYQNVCLNPKKIYQKDLYITFGGMEIANGRKIFSVKGLYNGEASIWDTPSVDK